MSGSTAFGSLCENCGEKKDVVTPRSRFLMCMLSQVDPNFPKYPRQPVIRCEGFRPIATDRGEAVSAG